MPRLTAAAIALGLLLPLLASCSPRLEAGAGEAPVAGSDLQIRLEEIRAQAAAEPTTRQNVFPRADVVWEWANSLALAGHPIPPDLPFTLAFIRFAEADGGEIDLPPGIDLTLDLHMARLDHYIRELGLRQDDPAALGRLRWASNDPLVSRAWVTLEQIYTVGAARVAPGGAFLLGRSKTSAEQQAQNGDPRAPNFVSVRSSNPDVRFAPDSVDWNGVHGNIAMLHPLAAYRVQGAALEPGDTVTFTYGDRSGGSPGFKTPTFSTDRLLLPIYVDVDGSGTFLSLEWPARTVVGKREIARVRLLGPSVAAPGEPFDLTVRSEDDAMNRASGPVPAYRVLLEEREVARIPAGDQSLVEVEDVTIDRPGVYRFRLRSDEGRWEAQSNPTWVREGPERRILWGDTHGHSGLAEGQGSARAFFSYARHDARLDFVTLSEHDVWMDDSEWRELQSLTREFTEEGRFSGILGYEWSAFRNRGGHHNVFFRRADASRVGVHDATRLPELYRQLGERYEPADVLIIPHAHRAGDWTRSDPELERLVELYSVHGSFEWFANMYLRNGFELGFVAAGDDHLAKPGLAPGPLSSVSQPGGLAAVLAPRNSVDEVFAALRDLATYATSGQRIVLDASLNGHPMGTRQPHSERRQLRCRVMGTAPIDRIDLVRNGEVIVSRSFLSAPLRGSGWLQIAFESSSEVFGPGVDNPRGYRPWIGTVEVEGARIVELRPVGIDNPLREAAEIERTNEDRIRFRLLTRGRADSFLVRLEGATEATRLTFDLEPARERGAAAGIRPPAELPGVQLQVALSELEDGRLVEELPVERHVDRVRLQLVDPSGELDREVELIDLEGRPGDYYYVRVTQLDGGRAWSSPFWVGGESR